MYAEYSMALPPQQSSPPPPSPLPKLSPVMGTMPLTAVLDAPGAASGIAVAILIFICCCCFCYGLNRCATGKSGGGGESIGTARRAPPGRRTRTAAYSGVAPSGEDADDYDDDYDDDYNSPRDPGPSAVRVVRVGTKPHPPTRMGGGRR